MDSKPMKNNFALRSIIPAVYLLSILFLTTPALSFNNKLHSALNAIANGTATKSQKALAYHNYNTVQNMRYHGQENGGIGETTFQKYMKSCLKQNNADLVKAGRQNGVEITFQKRNTITTGTDTDASGKIKSMKKLNDINKSYENIKRNSSKNNGIKLSGNENFRKIYNTDIMVDPNGVSKTLFGAMSKTMTGTTYRLPGAARYEIQKSLAAESGRSFKPTLADSNDYMQEQLRIIGEKGKAAKTKLKMAAELNKNPISKIKGTKTWTKYKNIEAELHFNQADQGKSIVRLQDSGKALAKAHNVATPEYSKLPGLGKIRGEGRLPQSSVVKALDKHVTQQALKNNAEVLADIGKKKPFLRYKTNQMITESTKNLPPSQKGELIESIRNKHGNDAAKKIAEEMRKTSSPTTPLSVPSGGFFGDKSFTVTKGNTGTLISTHTGVVGKVVGVAGITLMGLKVYDMIKYGNETGDWETVTKQGTQMAVTTAKFMVGAKLLTTAIPAAGPVLILAGTGAVFYQGTREIIERVPGAKKIDEVVTKKFEDEYFYSSRHDTQENVDLQNLLQNALKGGRWELPDGMTSGEAFQKALDNSNNRKKPVLGFLENVQTRLKAEQETLIKAAEEKLRIDSEKLTAELKAEEEAGIKAKEDAKLKAAAESLPATGNKLSEPEVPPKKWSDMTEDEKRQALATGQDGAWQSHLDAIINAQKKKVTESDGYDPTKDPGFGVSTDQNTIAEVNQIGGKFQQGLPTGQSSTQTGGLGGSVSPQSPAYTGGQIGGNSGTAVGGGIVGAGIPITVGGIPTLGPPLPPPSGGANVGGGTGGGTGNIGAGTPGGGTGWGTTGANVGGSTTGKQPCSFSEMCSVLPSSAQLGINNVVMSPCSKMSGAQTTYSKAWSTGATNSSRGVDITMTIYPTSAAAQADVQNYCGKGSPPVTIGDGGCWNSMSSYPYFKIYYNNVVIKYSSHKATRKTIPAQDRYISDIVQKIGLLTCQPSP